MCTKKAYIRLSSYQANPSPYIPFDIDRAVENNASFGINTVSLIRFVTLQVDIERGVLGDGHVSRIGSIITNIDCVNQTVFFRNFAAHFYGDGATFVKRQIAVVMRTCVAVHVDAVHIVLCRCGMLKIYGERTAPFERQRGNVVNSYRLISVRRGDGDFVVADKHDIHVAVVDSADCDFFTVVAVERERAVVALVGIPSPTRAGLVDRAARDLKIGI